MQWKMKSIDSIKQMSTSFVNIASKNLNFEATVHIDPPTEQATPEMFIKSHFWISIL